MKYADERIDSPISRLPPAVRASVMQRLRAADETIAAMRRQNAKLQKEWEKELQRADQFRQMYADVCDYADLMENMSNPDREMDVANAIDTIMDTHPGGTWRPPS